MRWFVEVSQLRPSLAPGVATVPPDSYVVEAKAWQAALQSAREFNGTAGPISQFSIELLPDGYRAVDPVGRLRYVIRRAPDDAVVTIPTRVSMVPPSPSEPPTVRPSVDTPIPAAARPNGPRAQAPAPAPPAPAPVAASASPSSRPPMMTEGRSPGAYSISERPGAMSGVESSRLHVAPPSAFAPATVATPPPVSVPAVSNGPATAVAPTVPKPAQPMLVTQKSPQLDTSLPRPEVLLAREENPSDTSPLTYREYVYVVPPGTNDKVLEQLIRACFYEVLAQIGAAPAGKLVNLAIFDVRFTGKPPRPPLATLAWKDWRGPEPEVRFPARERAVSAASAAPAVRAPAPVVAQQAPAAAPQASAAKPAPPARPAAPVEETPAPILASPMIVVPEPEPSEEIEIEIVHAAPPPPPPRPAAPSRAGVGAAAAAPARVAAPAPVAAAAPAPVAAPPAAPPPAPVVEAPSPPPAAPGQAPVAAAVQAAPAGFPVPASAPSGDLADPFAVARRAKSEGKLATGKRLSGDELLSDLFESMHDLHFSQTTIDGAHFVLTLAVEKLPSRVAICHFFDINKREFVVVHALAKGRDALVLTRLPERDKLATQALRSRRAIVISDAASDPRIRGGRWDAVGEPVTSVVIAPVALGGRFLGMLELANPTDGHAYVESDGYALAYMGEQLAEFLGQRGVMIEPEAIKAFKPVR